MNEPFLRQMSKTLLILGMLAYGQTNISTMDRKKPFTTLPMQSTNIALIKFIL